MKTEQPVKKVITRPAAKVIHATKMSVRSALHMVMNVEIANRTAVKVLSATHLLQGTRFVRPAVVKTLPVEITTWTAAKVLPATMVGVRPALLKVAHVEEMIPWTAAKILSATIVRVRTALLKTKPVETIPRTAVVL
eukprot:378840_1